MEITRNSVDTTPESSDAFAGTVYIDAVASRVPERRRNAEALPWKR
jgi:hypothetical protein